MTPAACLQPARLPASDSQWRPSAEPAAVTVTLTIHLIHLYSHTAHTAHTYSSFSRISIQLMQHDAAHTAIQPKSHAAQCSYSPYDRTVTLIILRPSIQQYSHNSYIPYSHTAHTTAQAYNSYTAPQPYNHTDHPAIQDAAALPNRRSRCVHFINGQDSLIKAAESAADAHNDTKDCSVQAPGDKICRVGAANGRTQLLDKHGAP